MARRRLLGLTVALVAGSLAAATLVRPPTGSAPEAMIEPPAPARAAPPAAAPSVALEITGETVPPDLGAEVRTERDGARVIVRRPGHLVSLRLGDAHAAGKDEASLLVSSPGAEVHGARLTWEASHLGTLATSRGVVEVDGAVGHLAMAAPPRLIQKLEGRQHRCLGLDDARGGFTALCSVRAASVRAASLTTDGPLDHAWVVPGARGEKIVRVDLPLEEAGSAAGAIGYLAAGVGTVVRLEASRLPGEPRAALLLAANEKRQPVPPPAPFNWGRR